MENQKGKRKISELMKFEDLHYLIDNFSADEISYIFKKCMYVEKNKI